MVSNTLVGYRDLDDDALHDSPQIARLNQNL